MTDRLDAIVAEILSHGLGRPVAPGEFVDREAEEAWDSLKHMEMVFALEAATGLQFSEEQIGEVANSDQFKALAETAVAS